MPLTINQMGADYINECYYKRDGAIAGLEPFRTFP
jgi:hypothetical protein